MAGLTDITNGGADNDEPLYVNAKQYNRYVLRREPVSTILHYETQALGLQTMRHGEGFLL